MEQEYQEVETEQYEEDLEFEDIGFIGISIFLACTVIGFMFRQIRSNFKNLHLKIGNKVEIGVETKDSNIKKEN